ncbi:MAG: DMT family transporter [Alphaproteobacteria bacterium]|nr:DMT family transporter [Alphaproteobacteria bacterium]
MAYENLRRQQPAIALINPLGQSRLVGSLLIVAGAACFSMAVVMARLTYDAGSNPITVISVRVWVGMLVLGILVVLGRNRFRVAPRNLLAALVIGTAVTTSALAYFAAFSLIPVSIAVLIFYTYPIFVGIAARFTERDPFTAGKFIALGLAFAGVALALNVDLASHDIRGLLLATVPAIIIGSVTLFGGRYMQGTNVVVMTFYMMLAGSMLMGLVAIIAAPLAFPTSGAGQWALVAVPVFFVFGNLCFFAGLRRIRAVDVAMLMNLEPVTTIAFALAILGDWLTPVQGVGAALILGAIFLMTWIRR